MIIKRHLSFKWRLKESKQKIVKFKYFYLKKEKSWINIKLKNIKLLAISNKLVKNIRFWKWKKKI